MAGPLRHWTVPEGMPGSHTRAWQAFRAEVRFFAAWICLAPVSVTPIGELGEELIETCGVCMACEACDLLESGQA